jgi:glycosyltransferase involved in cell wall biosynthesis
VLIQRQADVAPTLALERSAISGRRLVYDLDDAVWLSGRQTMGHPLGVLKASARKVDWIARRADWVIAGSDLLAEHVEPLNEKTTVVPSLVDPTAYSLRDHVQSENTTLGWIGSPTTAPYLSAAANVLETFARQSSRHIRLLVVGGRAPRIRGVDVLERAWSPQAERDTLAEMDIGLMPLPDTPWSRGKCAYKALQYMASGIPPLVDDVGVSASVVSGAGWIASDEAGWLEGLHSLAGDPEARRRFGAVGRARVEREFSLARWLPTLARILRGN